jgi:heat shock protein HtpX
MTRILLFIGTNIAILSLLSMTYSLFEGQKLLQQIGVELQLSKLLIYAAIMGFIGSLASLFFSKLIAIRWMGIRLIEHPTNSAETKLLHVIYHQSKLLGVRMPTVGVYKSNQLNAFATGRSKDRALIAVSSAILEQMTEAEVEAVLAHEMSHVANGDMVTMTLLQGVINTFVTFLSRLIGHTVDRLLLRIKSGHGPIFWTVSIVTETILGILAMLVVMWFSRYREYRADIGAAALVGNENMIAALQRLKAVKEAPNLPIEIATLAINSRRVLALFSSHPPLKKRIAALQSILIA